MERWGAMPISFEILSKRELISPSSSSALRDDRLIKTHNLARSVVYNSQGRSVCFFKSA
jgi:hypothetical protein